MRKYHECNFILDNESNSVFCHNKTVTFTYKCSICGHKIKHKYTVLEGKKDEKS